MSPQIEARSRFAYFAAVVVTHAPAALGQEKAKPEKPFTVNVLREYLENGKRKTKQMVMALSRTDFQIYPLYRDKKKTVEEQGGIVLTFGSPFTVEYSAMGSTGSINWGFGITTNNRQQYLLVKSGESAFLMRIVDTSKTPLFLMELEKRAQIKVQTATTK